PGGPPPPQVLPAKPGLNRANWDLRRETLPAVDGVFVMGDYRGHFVAPGYYLLRLFSATDTVEAAVRVLPDPRLDASHSDFAEQQSLLAHIETAVKDIHQSVNRLRSVKKQLNDRLELLRKMEQQDSLVKQGEAAL
ncbi:MAG: glycosyl hydrolase, partial [Saprospiraceae bacterium]